MHRKTRLALLGLAPILITACATTAPDGAESRALVQRFVEAANAHEYDELDDLLTAGFTRHSQATPTVQVRSREDMKAFLREDASTFPDGRVTIESMTAEGKRVAFQGTYSGTQAGPMGPFPATNKTMQLDLSGVFRIEGGRIAELWILWDNLAALAQLGHWPSAGGASDPSQAANKALAVTRFTSRGTHTGTFRGVEATGKEWVTEGICISRIENGKIAEDWEIAHVSGF